MTENKTELMIGALVLAVAAGFILYVGQTTGISASTAGYQISAAFRSAEGISAGTDVRLAGVKIGTVTDMTLNPETYRAEVTFAIQDGIDIPNDSTFAIESEGLLGGQYVEVVPGGSFEYLLDGDEALDTQGAVSLTSLLMKFVASGSSN
jgi:phospholipid/cholesterol/gamma-HCH transport system substrate-binding protein